MRQMKGQRTQGSDCASFRILRLHAKVEDAYAVIAELKCGAVQIEGKSSQNRRPYPTSTVPGTVLTPSRRESR